MKYITVAYCVEEEKFYPVINGEVYKGLNGFIDPYSASVVGEMMYDEIKRIEKKNITVDRED